MDRMLRIEDIVGEEGRAPILPICRATFYKLVRTGRIPKPVKAGKCSLWRASDIQKFMTGEAA